MMQFEAKGGGGVKKEGLDRDLDKLQEHLL